MKIAFIVAAIMSVLALASCNRVTDTKLVGAWKSGCSIDTCTITTLKADHTVSEKFDEKGYSDSYSGSWGVERDQLVLHVTWADKSLRDIVGKDMRLIISEFQPDTFVATLADDRTKTGSWKRLQ